MGSEAIDVVADEATGEERERLRAITAERISRAIRAAVSESAQAWAMARVSQPGLLSRLMG